MLTSKKSSEIVYYISLFVCHLSNHEILQYDNEQKFKSTLLIF